MLSKKSLELLAALFSVESNLSLPAGFADLVIEIRSFVVSSLDELEHKEILK